MKAVLRFAISIVILIALFFLIQGVFKVSLIEEAKKLVELIKEGGTITGTGVDLSKRSASIPRFDIISLEIFWPENISVIHSSRFNPLILVWGDIDYFFRHDSYVKLGVRNPDQIKMERKGDTIFVDESTIVIELLDVSISNFEHLATARSGPFAQNRDAEKYILEGLNLVLEDIKRKFYEQGQQNFDAAKNNFKENYRRLCGAMGLEVVYESGKQDIGI